MPPGSEAFFQLAQVKWESPCARQWSIEASTPLLSHCQHQPSPIWKVDSTRIHFLTEVLQVPSQSSVIEQGEVEPYLGLCRGDPAAQVEERHKAFPPTRLIAFPKVVIPEPHAQMRESNLQQSHDLIFGVIQFLHFAFACPEVFLLAQDVSEGSTGHFTVVQFAFSTDVGGCEQDASMMYFPLCF